MTKIKNYCYFLILLFTSSNSLGVAIGFDTPTAKYNVVESLKDSSQETIDYLTGKVILQHTDINIPGNNGMDLKFTRYFDNQYSLGRSGYASARGSFGVGLAPLGSSGWIGGGGSFKTNYILSSAAPKNYSRSLCEAGGMVRVPGEIMTQFLPAILDGQKVLLSKDNWVIKNCNVKPNETANIEIISPSGKKYLFSFIGWKNIHQEFNNLNATEPTGSNMGQNLKVTDFNGSQFTLTHNNTFVGYYKLTSVADAFNNKIEYIYNSNGKLTTIKRNDGTEITFQYNLNGDLDTLTYGSNIWKYEYETCANCVPMLLPNSSACNRPTASRHSLSKVKSPSGARLWEYHNQKVKVDVILDGSCNLYAYNLNFSGFTNFLGKRIDYDFKSSYPDSQNDRYMIGAAAFYKGTFACSAQFNGVSILGDYHYLSSRTESGPNLKILKSEFSYPYAKTVAEMSNNNGFFNSINNSAKVIEIINNERKIERTYKWNFSQRKWYESTDCNGSSCGSVDACSVDTSNGHGNLVEIITQEKRNGSWVYALKTTYNYNYQNFVDIASWTVMIDGIQNSNTSHARSLVSEINSYLYDEFGNTSTFTKRLTNHDEFGNPKNMEEISDSGVSRNTVYTYLNDKTNWYIGLDLVTTVQGKIVSNKTYNKNKIETDTTVGVSKKFSYYANGNINSETIHESSNKLITTIFTNYTLGLPKNILYSDGSSISNEYNIFGNIQEFTDQKGKKTTYAYDLDQRLEVVTPPIGDVVKISYPTVTEQNIKRVYRDNHMHVTDLRIVSFDANNKVIETAYFNFPLERYCDFSSGTINYCSDYNYISIEQYKYDAYGQLVFSSYPKLLDDPNKVPMKTTLTNGDYFNYDSLGRETSHTETSIEGQFSYQETKQYFSKGYSLINIKSASKLSPIAESFGVIKKDKKSYYSASEFLGYSPTELTSPTKIHENVYQNESGNNNHFVTTSIARNVLAQITSISKGGITRSYSYYDTYQLKSVADPEIGITEYKYYDSGSVKQKITNNLRTITFAYDENGRIASKTTVTTGFPNEIVNYDYDANGNLNYIANSGSIRNLYYNENNLIWKETLSTNGKNFQFEFNRGPTGVIHSIKYPDGYLLSMNIDGIGRVLSDPISTFHISYDAYSSPKQIRYRNGGTVSYQNTDRGDPKEMIMPGVINRKYQIDADGNLQNMYDIVGTTTKTTTLKYDGLNRLTQVLGNAGEYHYTYNDSDTLTSKSTNIDGLVYSLNTSNKISNILSMHDIYGTTTYPVTYDSFGNMNSYKGKTYTRNADGKIKTSTVSGVVTNVTYDGSGNRLRVLNSNDCYNVFSVALNKLLYKSCTNENTSYIYSLNKLLAKRVVTN